MNAHRARSLALLVVGLATACGVASTDAGPATEQDAGPAGSGTGSTPPPPPSPPPPGLDAGAPDAARDAGPTPADAGPDASAPYGAALDAALDAEPPDAAPLGPRSALFPVRWLPLHAGGVADAEGRALPDFA